MAVATKMVDVKTSTSYLNSPLRYEVARSSGVVLFHTSRSAMNKMEQFDMTFDEITGLLECNLSNASLAEIQCIREGSEFIIQGEYAKFICSKTHNGIFISSVWDANKTRQWMKKKKVIHL